MPRKTTLALGATACVLATIAGHTHAQEDWQPDHLVLRGIVRDFHERGHTIGHPDFERRPDEGFALYQGVVADELGADGKPVFNSRGVRVAAQAIDAEGNPILGKPYIETRSGDQPASLDAGRVGAIEDEDSLHSWYRDKPGVNVSKVLPITLNFDPSSGAYVFDDRMDPLYQDLGGFFPINDELFGNSANENKNFHFTYELETQFVYEEGAGHTFEFIGDDDVWVFVDGKLVIDLGGVHGKKNQFIDLDRLGWLEDGQTYKLHFFFAERHRTQSNFRIETTIKLRAVDTPASAAIFD